MKVGVIGAGVMGRNHCRVYGELGHEVLVFDPSPSATDSIKALGCTPCSTVNELIGKSDAISVCTPTSTHHDTAMQCIEAGKPVLIEKPIAVSIQEAEELVRAAQKAGTTLMVGHVERFNPAIGKLKEVIGDFGPIFSMSARRVGGYPARIKDCGVTIDLAIHDIDLMRWLANGNIKEVYANITFRLNDKNEDSCMAFLKFDNGAIGTIEVNWLTPTKIRSLTFTSGLAFGTVDMINQRLFTYEKTSGEVYKNYKELLRMYNPKTRDIPVQKAEPLMLELQHFLDCAKEGRRPLIDGKDGMEALRVAMAVLESAKTGTPIKMSGFR